MKKDAMPCPAQVLVVGGDRARAHRIEGRLVAMPEVGRVRRARGWSRRLAVGCDVAIVDHDLDAAPWGVVEVEKLLRAVPAVVTSKSASQGDVWMFRSCGAKGFVIDTAEIDIALRRVMRGQEYWPDGIGSRPDWYIEPLEVRLCAFVRGQEQARCARLIHDHVLQTLEGLALSPHVDSAVKRALTGEAARLRGFSRLLSRAEPASLLEELESVIAEFQAELPGFDLHLEFSLDRVAPLPSGMVRALAESTREALRNVAKHSGVKTARIRVSKQAGRPVISVADQGRGFDAKAYQEGFGLGQCIRARMRSVGGDGIVRSSPGRGTVVDLVGPGD